MKRTLLKSTLGCDEQKCILLGFGPVRTALRTSVRTAMRTTWRSTLRTSGARHVHQLNRNVVFPKCRRCPSCRWRSFAAWAPGPGWRWTAVPSRLPTSSWCARGCPPPGCGRAPPAGGSASGTPTPPSGSRGWRGTWTPAVHGDKSKHKKADPFSHF